MYLLAGLLGMMALGSVAIVTVGDGGDDPVPAGDDPCDPPPEDPGDMLDDLPADGAQMPGDDGPEEDVVEDGRSLFARMGLINLPGLDPVSGPDPLDGPPDGAADPGGAEVLDLDAFRVRPEAAATDAMPETLPDAGAPLDYDVAEDQLVIVFDDSAGCPEPELDMRVSGDDPDTTEITLDGTVLARLPTETAPPLSSIVLVGESDAVALGLAG